MYKLYLLFTVSLFCSLTCFAKNDNSNISTHIISKQSGDKSCKQIKTNQDAYLSGDICFYPNQSLIKVYKIYSKENLNNENGKHLRKNIIPYKNHSDVISKGSLEITYKWNGSKKLTIELSFAGGITTLIFNEKEKGTELTTIYDAG